MMPATQTRHSSLTEEKRVNVEQEDNTRPEQVDVENLQQRTR